MIVGFTGTRHGMTDAQHRALELLLIQLQVAALHHGDCIGADAQACELARDHGIRTVCHPPVDEAHRAHTDNDETREPWTHLARNRNIVLDTAALIACPQQAERQTHGGTWYTIGFARKWNRKVYVIAPDGTIDETEARE